MPEAERGNYGERQRLPMQSPNVAASAAPAKTSPLVPLNEDAVAWLRSRGAPLSGQNLNRAMTILAENPSQRPSLGNAVGGPASSGNAMGSGLQLIPVDEEPLPNSTSAIGTSPGGVGVESRASASTPPTSDGSAPNSRYVDIPRAAGMGVDGGGGRDVMPAMQNAAQVPASRTMRDGQQIGMPSNDDEASDAILGAMAALGIGTAAGIGASRASRGRIGATGNADLMNSAPVVDSGTPTDTGQSKTRVEVNGSRDQKREGALKDALARKKAAKMAEVAGVRDRVLQTATDNPDMMPDEGMPRANEQPIYPDLRKSVRILEEQPLSEQKRILTLMLEDPRTAVFARQLAKVLRH